MNFKPTIFKSLTSVIVGLVLGWFIYSAAHVCSVAFCYINLFQVYIGSFLFGVSGAVLVYGVWSSLQNGLVRLKFSVKLVAILIIVISSAILLYAFFFVSFKAEQYFPKPQGYRPFLDAKEEVILPFYVKKK